MQSDNLPGSMIPLANSLGLLKPTTVIPRACESIPATSREVRDGSLTFEIVGLLARPMVCPELRRDSRFCFPKAYFDGSVSTSNDLSS